MDANAISKLYASPKKSNAPPHIMGKKAAARAPGMEEFAGEDMARNKVLRYAVAESIVPEEIRARLKRAHELNVEMMDLENYKDYEDVEVYEGLQPKVFRAEFNGKNTDFYKIKELQRKIIEEEAEKARVGEPDEEELKAT